MVAAIITMLQYAVFKRLRVILLSSYCQALETMARGLAPNLRRWRLLVMLFVIDSDAIVLHHRDVTIPFQVTSSRHHRFNNCNGSDNNRLEMRPTRLESQIFPFYSFFLLW